MNKCFLISALIAVSAPVFAQSSQGSSAQNTSNPLSAGEKGLYGYLKNDVVKAAEQMPEENYSYRPVSTVRTFGQLVGHVADAQYEFCSVVLGDNKKSPDVEKTKTSKADLLDGLKTAFAYCDRAYDGMTDAHAADLVKFFGHDMAKLTVLSINNAHTDEHYGNIVTYMRMKGMVPPSSQRSGR